jgi:hypothetical protein
MIFLFVKLRSLAAIELSRSETSEQKRLSGGGDGRMAARKFKPV